MYKKKDLGLLVLILVVGAAVALINPRFLLPGNLSNTANQVGLFGLFSIGEAFVIITGGIELSVGSMIALLGAIFIDLIVNHDIDWAMARHRHRRRRLPARRRARAARHEDAPPAIRGDPVRSAHLSRHRALLHPGRHRRLRLRRRAFRRSSG